MSSRPPLGGLAARLAAKRFGIAIERTESFLSVTPALKSFAVYLNSPDRVFWVAMNRSPYHLEISFTQNFVYGTGLLLSPNGGWASMAVDEDGDMVTYPLWVQTPVAPAKLYTLELFGA